MAGPPNLLSIGTFAALTRLTVKALRHYDEVGVLRAAWVDPSSGYRYYAPSQLDEAQRIWALRALDLPLDDVAVVLERGQADGAVLAAHRERLAGQIERLRELLEGVERQLSQARPTFEVALRELEGHRYVAVRREVALSALATEIPQMFAALGGFLTRFSLKPVGPPFSIHHVVDASGDYRADLANDALPIELGFPVADVIPRDPSFVVGELAPCRALVVGHRGHFSETRHAHRAVVEEAARLGLELSPPPREHYLEAPGEDGRASARTEVVWPVTVPSRESAQSPLAGG